MQEWALNTIDSLENLNTMIAVDLCVFIALLITTVGLSRKIHESKSTKRLLKCCKAVLCWLVINLCSFGCGSLALNVIPVIAISTLNYTFESIVFIFYLYYCKAFLETKTNIIKWAFYIPAGLLGVNTLYILYNIAVGTVFKVENGTAQIISGSPKICTWFMAAMILYLPLIGLIKVKKVGKRTVGYLASYSVAPMFSTVVSLLTGNDYSAIASAFSLMIVATMLQNDQTAENLKEINDDLTAANEEMEAQIIEIRDLNDELEAQADEILEAKNAAIEANQAKTSFLFNMSHDIRTPMNAIVGFTDLLEKHQEEPQKRADYLAKIKDANGVLLSLINNVLEMARIEKGTLELVDTATSVTAFQDSLYSIFQEMMENKQLTFTSRVQVEHEYMLCDPIKLQEVMINIVSNAYKYTPSGGSVTMSVEEVPCDREGYANYRTTVADTGMGMSEEFLPHLFEEFSRENNTTGNKIEGTGLGMPIVKRLVELMGGTIAVTSKKGEGTTFVVTIPHKIASKDDLESHDQVEIDENAFRGKKILLAEDNELNAEIATEILTEAGFTVKRAEDGEMCCDMLSDAPAGTYDLILMDIQMPKMNGYEATAKIRSMEDQEKAGIKILAMTANAFEEDKRAALEAGMDGHLAKPIDIASLLGELTRVLA